MLKKFVIQDLASLNEGREAAKINNMIRMAVQDCMNRPSVKSGRLIGIKLSVAPVKEDSGVCHEVNVEVRSTMKLPAQVSRPFVMKPQPGTGDLLFNDVSPKDTKQMTIDEAVVDEGVVDEATGEVLNESESEDPSE